MAAVVAREVFFNLDAPVELLASPDSPISGNASLMNAVIQGVGQIVEKMRELVNL